MSTALDHRWAMRKETVFGTPPTLDSNARFYPWVPGTSFQWDTRPRQGEGIVGGYGRRGDLASRRFLPAGQGTIKTIVELETRGVGLFLDVVLGVSTVTAITGGSQQVFHVGVSGMTLPSATLQVVKVRNDGSEVVETYSGCTATKVTIEQPQDGIVRCEVEWDAAVMVTSISGATASWGASPVLFDSSQVSALGYGGSVTPPTSSALGTGPSASVLFRSWKIEVDQAAAVDRWVLGGRAQPTVGKPGIKFSADVEFTDTTITGAYLTGTSNPWYVNYVTSQPVGAGAATLQVLCPKLALTKGVPDVEAGKAPTTHPIEADILNDGSNRDLYVVLRTPDTAL